MNFFKAYFLFTLVLSSSSMIHANGDGNEKIDDKLAHAAHVNGDRNEKIDDKLADFVEDNGSYFFRGSEGGGGRKLDAGLRESCSLFNPCKSGLSCQPGVHKCYHVPRRKGEPCSAGYGCGRGLTCEAGSHVCRGPGDVGDACHATRPCGSGLSCQPGVHKCYHVPRRKGEPCSAGYGCGGDLTCEAGSHICRAPGKLEDPCHLTRPCGDGLSCQPGVHKCYHVPRREDEPCSAGYGCKNGLQCEAGAHICRAPGKHGDPCHATRKCGSGYHCVDAISASNYQMCIPDCTNLDKNTRKKLDDGYSPRDNPGFDEKWNDGTVPFQADCELENVESALFAEAMKHIEEKTGIEFVRYDPNQHQNWVILTNIEEDKANSWVGKMKQPGWQRVNLDSGWLHWLGIGFDLGSTIHELVHALGWQHTQARPDRDNYVTIKNKNIKSGKEHNFEEVDSNVYEMVQKCRGYDYESIMHYSDEAFSKNGELTIVTKDSSKQDLIGQREGLSEQDVLEIKEYYFAAPTCFLELNEVSDNISGSASESSRGSLFTKKGTTDGYDAYVKSKEAVKEISFKAGDTTMHKKIGFQTDTSHNYENMISQIDLFPNGTLEYFDGGELVEATYEVDDSFTLIVDDSVDLIYLEKNNKKIAENPIPGEAMERDRKLKPKATKAKATKANAPKAPKAPKAPSSKQGAAVGPAEGSAEGAADALPLFGAAWFYEPGSSMEVYWK